jgi:hypothetical protein
LFAIVHELDFICCKIRAQAQWKFFSLPDPVPFITVSGAYFKSVAEIFVFMDYEVVDAPYTSYALLFG